MASMARVIAVLSLAAFASLLALKGTGGCQRRSTVLLAAALWAEDGEYKLLS